jgi:hypothetical protein
MMYLVYLLVSYILAAHLPTATFLADKSIRLDLVRLACLSQRCFVWDRKRQAMQVDYIQQVDSIDSNHQSEEEERWSLGTLLESRLALNL